MTQYKKQKEPSETGEKVQSPRIKKRVIFVKILLVFSSQTA